MGPEFKVSSERLEKPRIESTTPGLQGEKLYHFFTEASLTRCMMGNFARFCCLLIFFSQNNISGI